MEKVVRMAGLLLDSAPFGSSSGSKYNRDQDEGGDPANAHNAMALVF